MIDITEHAGTGPAFRKELNMGLCTKAIAAVAAMLLMLAIPQTAKCG
jgi:hypothetical protein